MKSVEATGKNVQEARRLAAEMLGVSEDKLSFEVISKPGTLAGLFGGGECRVRASLTDEEPEVTAEEEAEVTPTVEKTEGSTDDADAAIGDSAVEEVGREAAEFIKHVISEIGISDPQVSLTQTGDQEITLNIEGDDLGIIIGRRGETLDALQLITAIAANRQREDGARVILDAENYRERHEDMLRDMALEYADDAKNRGEEVVIPDLKAYERRIVHMALRDDTSVRTYSEGEGRDRVLVISPTDM